MCTKNSLKLSSEDGPITMSCSSEKVIPLVCKSFEIIKEKHYGLLSCLGIHLMKYRVSSLKSILHKDICILSSYVDTFGNTFENPLKIDRKVTNYNNSIWLLSGDG